MERLEDRRRLTFGDRNSLLDVVKTRAIHQLTSHVGVRFFGPTWWMQHTRWSVNTLHIVAQLFIPYTLQNSDVQSSSHALVHPSHQHILLDRYYIGG